MYKIIALAAIVVFVTLSTVSAKCDIMKEFKPEVESISGWAKTQCDSKTELSDADLKKGNDCFNKCLDPVFKSDNGKAVANFVKTKIFGNANIKKVCKDKKVQEQCKKDAMKDIGMKKGMECKKEIEADCPTFKKALQAFAACVKG